MKTITADGVLYYILAFLGGALLRYIWDKFIKEESKKEEKAKKYDEQEMKEIVTNIVQDSCDQIKEEMLKSMNDFKNESKSTFDYWQKMYWDAIDRLESVRKDFVLLKEQDVVFYKRLLIDTCKDYISHGKMTQYQFDRLTEWYKIYKELGGNSQGDLYYKKAVALPIVDNEHSDTEDEFDSIFDYDEQIKK